MLKTVTYEQFVGFGPCWLENEAGRKRLKRYASKREQWTALDILALNRVSAEDRLWAVLREEFIPAQLLHEFACRCAEWALSKVDHPDSRSIAAIQAKRDWLAGKITDRDLAVARVAARDAVWVAARDAAGTATWTAAWDAARYAARDAARDAAWDSARDAARKWQVQELTKMLEEYEEGEEDAAD